MTDGIDRRDKTALGDALGIPAGDPALGTESGVAFWRADLMAESVKAPRDGVYTLNGGRFRAREGELLPPGAVFEDEGKPAPKDVKAKTGPAADTKATGPTETTG